MYNTDLIGQRIEILRSKLNNISISDLEKGNFKGDKRLLGNATIAGWLSKSVDWTSDKLDKFLTHYGINREWWKTGKGEVFKENNIYIETAAGTKETMTRESVYAELIEKNVNYRILPTLILLDHKIVPNDILEQHKKEIERHTKEVERQDILISKYEKLIERLEGENAILRSQVRSDAVKQKL